MKRYNHYQGTMRESDTGVWIPVNTATELLDALRRAERLLDTCEFDQSEDQADLDIVHDVLERLG